MSETKSISTKWIIISVIIVVLTLVLILQRACNQTSTEREQVNLVNALQDSLRIMRNRDSSQTATITTIKTEQVKTFTNLNIKDKEIEGLQSLVESYKNKLKAGSSVSKGTIETDINAYGYTIIYQADTVRKDSLVYIWPTYGDSAENKWVKYKIVSNRVRTRLNLKVKNDFSVIVGSDRGKPFAQLTTSNPYSEVSSFRTYQVTMPKVKRWSIGPNVSGGISSDLKFRGFVGIGIQYNIIKF